VFGGLEGVMRTLTNAVAAATRVARDHIGPIVFVGLVAWLTTQLTLTARAADRPAHTLANSSEAIRLAIQARLSDKAAAASEWARSEQGALLQYYAAPDNHLLWVDANGLTDKAEAVIAEIEKADDYGLRPSDYPLPKPGKGSIDVDWLANAEIKVGLAVIDYARDARGGRIEPARLSPNLDPSLALPDPLELMQSIAIRADPVAYLRSFQPDRPQFKALRQALIAARTGSADPAIPEGPILQLGMDHKQVALLRKRLHVSTPSGVKDTLFDAPVEDAVKRFKAAQGAVPDGIVGPETRQVLNRLRRQDSNRARLRQILINMERWRWLPRDLGAFYVTVNVPEFVLRVMQDGKPIFNTRVVVGKPDKQTPIFSHEIEEVVFNPFWNMPNSIKTEEILPHIWQEDTWLFGGGDGSWNTAILQRNNLRVAYKDQEIDPSTLDWNHIDIRSLNIYQPPGPNNVLGSVKFMFPNKHEVYIHDTPQRQLFAKAMRAESHGCMRVQNPDQLALTLLKHDQGWTPGQITAAIENGHDQHVALKQAIPVYITYFTLRASDDGSISTFGDVYSHDARMAAALFGDGAAFDVPMSDNARERRNKAWPHNSSTASLSRFIEN